MPKYDNFSMWNTKTENGIQKKISHPDYIYNFFCKKPPIIISNLVGGNSLHTIMTPSVESIPIFYIPSAKSYFCT